MEEVICRLHHLGAWRLAFLVCIFYFVFQAFAFLFFFSQFPMGFGRGNIVKRVDSIELDFHEAAVSVHPHDSTADVERIFGTVRPKPGTPGALPVLVPQGPTEAVRLFPAQTPIPLRWS